MLALLNTVNTLITLDTHQYSAYGSVVVGRKAQRHQHVVEALADLLVIGLAVVVEGLYNLYERIIT